MKPIILSVQRQLQAQAQSLRLYGRQLGGGKSSSLAKTHTTSTELWLIAALLLVAAMLLAPGLHAAGTTGTALQAAFTSVNEMVGGYGKSLLTVLAFGFALIGYIASNGSQAVMKFVGFAIFGGVGLGAATTLVGAVV